MEKSVGMKYNGGDRNMSNKTSKIIWIATVMLVIYFFIGLLVIHREIMPEPLNLEQIKTVATMLGVGGILASIMLFIVSMKPNLL